MLFLSWLHRLRWPATIRQPSSNRLGRQRKLQEGVLALTVEGLEARQVLTGTVVVNTFNDLPDADPFDGVADADLTTTGLQTSLRAAVMHANATPGLETIVLSTGTYQLTIDGSGENNSATGDLDLFSDIEIIGAGSQNTTIEMGFAGGTGPAIQDRVIDIFGTSKVLIQGLQIQKGHTVGFGESGGGIRANSDVELRNVTLLNNQTNQNGGGLSVGFAGTVTLVGSAVTSNSAILSGGGISSQGLLKVYDSSLTNNTTGANGGAIASSGSLEVIRSLIQGNVANTNGGGIDSTSGSTKILGSTVKSNVATNGQGGGLSFRGNGTDSAPVNVGVEIQFSEVSDNTAQSGGGILMNSSGMLTLQNSTVAGNTAAGTATAGGQAGGILQLRGNAVVTNSTISGNSATSLAGAAASEGGGLLHQGGTLSFLNATIANNSAANGGGLSSRAVNDPSKNRVSFQNTIVATNTATASGPDLFASSSPFFSNGHNLIGVGIGPFANNVNGDIVGTIAAAVNPQLAPLANYGGGTRTQKLNAGSPAIDAGSNLGVSGSDQRGAPRILNGGTSNTTDIGAFEAGFTGFFVDTEADSTDINPGDGVAIDASGKTSLRAAIQEANALGGTQTIVVPAGNYRLTITGAAENSAATGDLDITQSVNIRGAGAAATIIDGNFTDRVFDVFSGATTAISGMSITNGMRNGTGLEARGGGIRINSASVLVDQVAIRNNVAADFGGGIANDGSGGGGGLTIRNSSLQFNRGASGGAIHNFNDSLVIENSLLDSNNAINGPGGALAHVGPGTIIDSRFSHNSSTASGGAIAISQNIASPATTTISGSEISENTANSAGGIGVSFDTLNLQDSVVANNTANAGFGGGLLVDSGTLNVLRSSVNGNRNLTTTGLSGGGGITAVGASLTLTESQIDSNTSNVPGGGLFLESSTTANVLRSTISRNLANEGAGVSNSGTLTIENSTFSMNNSSGNGGGLFDSGTTTISSSTFTTNSAASGGGIFATNSGTRSLKNTIVAGNLTTTNHDADVSGTTFTTSGNNLIGDIDTAVGFLNETNGDIVGGEVAATIDSVSGNSTSPIVITVAGHGLQNGDRVRVVGVTGNTAANGTFTITRIDANQFSLNNSMPNGNYGGGGNLFFLIDPRLGPLVNNTNPFAQNTNFGNPNDTTAVVTLFPQSPETHALLLDSPAIDRGNDSGSPTTDQRGFARINVAGVGTAGVATDIGAVELFHTTASGVIFADLNGNGLREVNEQGRGGITVFLDSNANGRLDFGEPFTTTAFSDDAFTPEIEEVGSYTLTFVPPGSQIISEVLPFNSRQTTGVTPPRFSSATEIATGADPISAITGDFNSDGTLDLAFVQTSSNLLTIIFRLPDGNFGTPVSFAVGSTPKEVVSGDLNGDGRLDLIVVNKDSNDLSVFFSNTTGFDAVQTFAVGTSPRALVLADLDRDGDLDIAVANEGSDDVSLLQQSSPGVFTALSAVDVGDGPRDIIATDLNNDGHVDLVTADKLSSEISLLRNDNTGFTFTRTAISLAGTLPSSLLAEDFDRDGRIDLVVGAVGTGEVLLLPNSGPGTFGSPIMLLNGVDATSLGSSDVDQDGDSDLIVPSESTPGTINVLINDNGAFSNSFAFTTGTQPASITFADFNDDGRRDLITANIGSDNLTVLSNLTGSYSVTATTGTPLNNLDFGNQDLATVTGTIFYDFNSNGLQDRDEQGLGGVRVFLDMNGNGRQDSFEPQTTTSFPGPSGGLAGSYFFQGLIPGKYRVYQVLTPEFVQTTPRAISFDEGIAIPVGDFISDILTTDLNNDGKADVISLSRESSGNGLVHIFFGTNNGPTSEITVGVGSQPKRVQVGDLDHDGDLDVLVMNSGDDSVSLILNDAGTFSVVTTVMLSGTPNDLAVGDINGDGDADLIVSLTRASGNDSIEIFTSAGGLTFSQSFLSDANNDTAGIALVDLDNDTDLDLVAANRATEELLLFSNNGTGGFAQAGIYSTVATPGAIAVGYFNGDALPDIAVVSQSNNEIRIHNSATPFVYTSTNAISTTSPASDIEVADVNRDGLDDIAFTNANGKLIIAQGTLNGLFQIQTDATFLASTTGSALAFANFNDDTLLDVIIGQNASSAALTLGKNQLFGTQVNLTAGGFASVNFGQVELGTISGRIFIDNNANGVRDPGEDNGFGDLQVFVDLNRNGRRDPYEPSDITSTDGGTFAINGVAPNNSHLVVAQSPLGTLRTGPFGLQFGPPTSEPISGARPQFVGDLLAIHDFGDGDKIIALNPHENSLTITSNYSGALSAETLIVGQSPTAIRLGNINSNSQLDVIVANNADSSLTVFFDGIFTTATTIPGIATPRAIELIDVNNDGLLDVVVTSSSSGNLTILTNDGFGGFTSSTLTVIGADSGEDIARADIDGDGDQDLVFIDSSNDKAFVLRNNSDGTLTQIGTIATGDTPVSLDGAGDFDLDGSEDFVLTTVGDKTLQVLLNDGSGNFTAVTYATLTDIPGAIDFDTQSRRIAVTLLTQPVLAVFAVNPNATLSPPRFVTVTGGQDSVLLLDINKDGKSDLISTDYGNGLLDINDDWTSPVPGTFEVRLDPFETLEGLDFATQDLRSTSIILNGNDLQIDDILGGNSNDDWSLTIDADSVTLQSNIPNEFLTSEIVGAIGDGTDHLTIPLTAFSGGIIFNGGAGADTLRLNVTAGLSRLITFNGGAPTSGSGDTLILESGNTFDSVTYSFTDASSGSIQFSGNGLINYTGLEPIISSVAADDVSLQFGSDSETIQITAGPTGHLIVDSTSGESLTFLNPSKSLTILSGGGDDTVTLLSADSLFRASLTLDGEAGNDVVQIGVSLLLGSATSTGDLTLTGEAISINAASIATNGDLTNNRAGSVAFNGAVTLGANVTINTDSTTTNDGTIVLNEVDSDDTVGGGHSLAIMSGSATTTLNNLVGATTALADLDVTAAVIALNSDIYTDGGSLTFIGDTRLVTDVLIDTEQGADSAAGSVTFSSGSISAVGANHNLTINTSTGGSDNSGAVALNAINNSAGQSLFGLSVNATNAGSGSAGDVTVNNEITLANDGSFDASGRAISLSTTNSDVTVSGTGTVTLTATRAITLFSGASIQTVNGNISLNANQQSPASTGTFAGIRLNNSFLQTSGSGDISLVGKGGNASRFNHGITLENGATIRSTDTGVSAGTISLTGVSGGGTSDNVGVMLIGAGTEIRSVDGNITLNGTGGNGSGDQNDGVDVRDGAAIRSTGTVATAATITITGTAGAGASDNDGVQVSGTSTIVVSQAGLIQIAGTGGAASGDSNDGVVILSGGQVVSSGTGNNVATITIDGTGGTGTEGNNGVVIEGTDARIQSIEGDISVSGIGGVGSGGFHRGTYLLSGGTIASTGTGANAADIFVGGIGGTGNGDGSRGIQTQNAATTISSVDGRIELNGFGGVGTGFEEGIMLFGGTIKSTGTSSGVGNILISGIGGTSPSGSDTGVYLFDNDAVLMTNSGDITVDGIGGGGVNSSGNWGIEVSGLVMSGGEGAITFSGIGGTGTGGDNVGISASSNSQITTAGGDLSFYGISGSGPSSPAFRTSTSGTVQINTGSSGPINVYADSVRIGANTTIRAGALSNGSVTFKQQTNGVTFNLGSSTDNASNTVELSDAELDHISAGKLFIGNNLSGTITISNSISRASATDLILTTGSNHNISFTGSTAGLNANGGSVSLILNGTGAILSGTASNDVIANRLILSSDGGNVGASGNPLSFDANLLVTNSTGNGNQFLQEAGTVLIDPSGLSAGTGTIQLSGGTYSLNSSNRIDNNTVLDVQSGATFKLNGFIETVAGLTGNGTVLNGSGTPGSLTLSSSSNLTFDGVLGGATANDQKFSLNKSGTGTLTLAGANTFTGLTTINAGKLLLNGSLTSDVVVASGGTFGGSGTIGSGHTLTVNNGGTLAPGNSPGIVNSGSVVFDSGSTFSVELNGTTAGTSYDQLNVTGTVDLNGATLDAILGFTPAAGATFVIVNNDGSDAISGTFASLSQGALLTVGGQKFHIYYDFNNGGGQTNDVALIVNRAPQINAQSFNLNENSAFNTTVGTVVASDSDGGALSYAISAGNTSNAFTINPNTGEIRVRNVAAIDFETNPSFSLTVDVTDDAGVVTSNTITINLNDLQSNLSINNASTSEGDSGTKTLTFSVTSSAAINDAFTIDFNTAKATAGDSSLGSDSDFIANSGTLNFAGNTANETQTFSITINGDTVIEGNETFDVLLSNLLGTNDVAITTATGHGTITNNDTTTLTISSPTITEGDSGTATMTFTVTSPKAVEGGFTVAFNVSNITTNSSDFTVVTNSPLTFSGTANETQTITINVNGDTIIEGDETFSITLGTVTPVAPVAAASIATGATGTGTVNNNDTSTLTISSPTVTEGNSGTTTMTFTVTSPKAVEGGFTVAFNVDDITPNGSDYTVVTSSPLTFSGTANETQTITINVNGDSIVEGDESFTITLGAVTPVTPVSASSITTGATGTGTITNNDSSTLSINSPTITEGDSGTTTMTFTVTSPNAVEGGFTVAFSVANITTNSSDYTVVTSSPLIFNGTANETQSISININGDAVIEGNETFSITLGTITPVAPVAAGSIGSGAVGTGTINNNDTSTLVIGGPIAGSPTVLEGDSGTTTMTFTVISPKAVQGGFTVAFSVADITTNSSDYGIVTNSPLNFTGSANEIKTITINVNGDDLTEATETLSVTLGAVTPPALVATASITSGASDTGTITNDDFTPAASAGGPYVINEGSGLLLSASATTDNDTPNNNLTYLWDIDGDGQFTENITGVSPNLTTAELATLGLSNGLRRNNITVQVTDGTNVSTASTQLTVNNLPPSPPIDLLPDVVNRVIDGIANGTSVGIQAHSTDPGNDSVTYRLTDDAGGRFAIDSITGEITVANNLLLNSQVSASHIVTVVATDADSADSQPVNFTIEVRPAPPPTASIIPDTEYVVEGDSGFVYIVFSVQLSGPSVLPIDIDFTTVLSGEPDAARDSDDPTNINNPRDFYKTSGSIHFNPFSTEELIRLQIQPDLVAEMDETFLVQLTTATNADLSSDASVASAIIRDDDTVPQLIVSNPSFLEGDPASGTPNELVYTLTVSGQFNSSGHASLHFATGNVGDTADPGVDYTSASGDLDFNEAQRTILIRVPIIGDLTDEADETVSLVFTNASGLGIPVTPATGTIINDDSPNAVLQIDSQVAIEQTGANSTVIFTVTLIGKPSGPVTVNYDTVDETATAGSDYSATSGILTFLPGGPVTQSIPVTIIGDSLPESAKETFALSLSSAVNATLDSQSGIGIGSILDDDGNVIISEADQIAAELTAIFNQFGGDKNNPALVAALLEAASGIADRLGFIKALVIVIDPVDFILNDTQGRQSGFTESTGVVNQIPGTYYSGNGPVELLIVPLPPDGVYNLQLAGLGGPFNAAIAVTINGETQSTSLTSSLENGSNLQVSINVGGTVPNNPVTLTIPVGLGLAGQTGNGNSTFGVVGADDRFVRRDLDDREDQELQSSTEMTLENFSDSPFDQLVNWIRVAQTTREKLVRQLFESLDLPFENLLDPNSGSDQKLADELVDLFWKRLGQTLTGVPAGAYKLGDMLENLLPQNPTRSNKKTPSEQGKGEPGTNGKSSPKIKRAPETRQRQTPRSSDKSKHDTNQQRSQVIPQESSPTASTDNNPVPQNASTLGSLLGWLKRLA